MPAKPPTPTALATPEKKKADDPVRTILKWILAGQAEADIVDAIALNWPSADPRPLIVTAIEQLSKAGTPDANLIRGFAIEGTREIFRKASEVGDHAVALRALKQLTELAR